MCDANQTQKKDKDHVGSDPVLSETEDACERVRKELEALRNNRTKLKSKYCMEIELHKSQFQSAKAKLERKLPEHAHIKSYRQFLQYYQREHQESSKDATTSCMVPASTYIIQQETPLLSAMHRSFCVLPHQKTLIRINYEDDIFPYMKKEIEDLNLDALEVSNQWMRRLSDQGEEIDDLYEKYRQELENIEMEVKRHRGILSQQNAAKNSKKEGDKHCDESSILSDTEHSESDDYSSSREEAGGGILKEALNLFHPASHHEASSSSVVNITGAFHGHINNFFQSFTLKDDGNDA